MIPIVMIMMMMMMMIRGTMSLTGPCSPFFWGGGRGAFKRA